MPNEQIFISYSSLDRILVEHLCKSLEQHHYKVWVDYNKIEGGMQWEREIREAIPNSQVCLVVLTPNSIQSEWVQKEIELSKDHNLLIIPIIMQKIEDVQASLAQLDIDDLHYIDFVTSGYDEGFKKLLKALPAIQIPISERNLKALIIEDIPRQQQTIQEVFSLMGIESVIVSDFDSALNVIRSPEQFDIVTLDMQLDTMDPGGQQGVLLLDQLKSYQRHVPVIIISALEWSGTDVRDFLLEYKVADYLKKPFKPHELRPKIESALESSKQKGAI